MAAARLIMSCLLVEGIAMPACDWNSNSGDGAALASSFLQSQRAVSVRRHKAGNVSEGRVSLRQNRHISPNKFNPSGAAASLTEEGYFAVADRNCHAEMSQFIERQVFNLGYQPCDQAGLHGLSLYHSHESMQTFEKLTADILRDAEDRCTWLGASSEECEVRPIDCPEFSGVIPTDCGCCKSKAIKLNFTLSEIIYNNIGGVGPNTSDPQELRIRGGETVSGVSFDLVVTTSSAYMADDPSTTGVAGGFGKINMKSSTSATFRFSFCEPGTGIPMVVSEVHISIFDLDGMEPDRLGFESAASSGYRGYVTDKNPAVTEFLDNSTGKTWTLFEDTECEGWGIVNSPANLTDRQRSNSVMYFYTNVTEFEIDFVIEGGDTGRNLYFSFDSPLDERCAP